MSDLVKFHELERAELEDVTALQTLTLEYLQRVIGSVIGAEGTELSASAGGVITLPSYTEDTGANTITLNTFSFVEVFRGGAAQGPNFDSSNVEARIGRYDSGAAWAGALDVSAVTIVSPSSLWARTVRQSGDAQARRKWDTALSSEVPVTLDTRELEQVELAVSAANPAPAQGVVDSNGLEVGQWVKVGELSRVIGTPTIRIKWLSIWDTDRAWLLSPAPHAGSDEAQIALNAKSGLSEYADAGIEAASGFTRGFSLRDHLKLIRGQLQRIINQGSGDTASDASKNWLSAPLVSLRNVAARLGAVETGLSDEVTARETQGTALSARPRVIAYGSIRYQRLELPPGGVQNDISLFLTPGFSQFNIASVGASDQSIYSQQRDRLQNISIEFDASLAGVRLLGMQAQINMSGLTVTASTWDGLKTINAEIPGGALGPSPAFIFPQLRLWEGARSYQTGSPPTNQINDRAYGAGNVIPVDQSTPLLFRLEMLAANQYQGDDTPAHGAMIFDGAGVSGAPDLVNGWGAGNGEFFDVLLTFWGVDP